MQIDDNSIAFKVEDSDAKEERNGGELEVIQVFGQFRILAMVWEAVANYDENCEYEENVRSHGHVGEVFEWA